MAALACSHSKELLLHEDRVLSIAGLLPAQADRGDLFEQIFEGVLEGTWAEPGDGRRFLRGMLGLDG